MVRLDVDKDRWLEEEARTIRPPPADHGRRALLDRYLAEVLSLVPLRAGDQRRKKMVLLAGPKGASLNPSDHLLYESVAHVPVHHEARTRRTDLPGKRKNADPSAVRGAVE